jgi:PAS domain S-box-containing protein
MRILYIEDHSPDTDLIQRALAGYSYQVSVVPTLKEAQTCLASDDSYDLILLDLHLRRDLGLLSGIREQAPHLAVVVLMNCDDDESRQSGATDYLVKTTGYLYKLPVIIENAFHRVRLVREQAALREREESFRLLFESNPRPMWVYDLETLAFLEVNDAAVDHYGFTREEFLSMRLTDIRPSEETARLLDNVREARPALQHSGEWVHRLKNGQIIDVEITSHTLEFAGRKAALVVAQDITERKLVQQAEYEQRMLAEALAGTANALISALSLDTVMNTILEGVARVVPHDAANIMLIEGDHARPAYLRGYLPEYTSFVRSFSISVTQTPNLHLMVETGSFFLASRTDQYSDWIHQPQTEWVKSYVAAPIRSHGKVIGFLNLDSGTPGFFNERHAQHLQTFADQASIAIEHAQLYEEIHRHAASLEDRVEERTGQLNQTLKHIEAILNSSDDIIVLCNIDGSISQVNPAFNKAFVCQPLLLPLSMLILPDHIPLFEQAFEKTITTLQSQRLEVTVQCEERAFDADIVLSPVIDQDRISGVVCSLRDISERKQMEARLRRMLEHEIELSDLKSRYVSMAAHDLRNPLTLIQLAVSSLHQHSDRLTPAKKEDKYHTIQTSIKVMVDMLDDILTLGQVESGKLNFEPVEIDVLAFCESMVSEIKQAAGVTRLIHFTGEGECRTAYLDARLLRHILGNLLSNALKYSPENCPVMFSSHCDSNQITFRIQDQGIGIPDQDQPRLFDTFYRASNAKKLPGTGLGLAIVKQSVELHGGTITFESREDVGTTFTVVIPKLL